MVVVVIVVLAITDVVVTLAVVWWPKSGPTSEGDRLAAEGVLFAAGAFLSAVIGTLVAGVAYVNSTEKPELGLRVVEWQVYPDASGCSVLRLRLILGNHGVVAARFVSIRVTIRGALMFGAPLIDLGPWRPPAGEVNGIAAATWEGGADAVVHPGWDYEAPLLGPVAIGPLIYADGDERPSLGAGASFSFVLDVVADEVRAFRREYVARFDG